MTEPTKISREVAAVELMRWHFDVDPDLIKIYWIKEDYETDDAPIRLLEVSGSASNHSAPLSSPDSVTEYSYDPAKDFPYSSKVIEVTKGELRMLARGELRLPEGWNIREGELGEEFERNSPLIESSGTEVGRVDS